MPSLQRVAALFFTFIFCAALPALAAKYPDAKESRWIARDFRFHAGEVMPEVMLHYRTIGEPALILHSTTGMAKFYKMNSRNCWEKRCGVNTAAWRGCIARDSRPATWRLPAFEPTIIGSSNPTIIRKQPWRSRSCWYARSGFLFR